MTFVSELSPKELWTHFDKILTIPRGSKNEKAIAQYVIDIAKKNKLSHKQDTLGNIVVSKPGTPGREGAPITILQSHLDMVNEKNADVEHNFETDSIKPRREGDYLYATGTTLGSDNGLGVAAALALMESKDAVHGPLELLFTVDEETGLTGAGGLAKDMLKGRRLINLDTEEEGTLYVGCAGGAGVNINLDLAYAAAPAGSVTLDLKLRGMKGGHSGVDIHLQRGNAVRLLARALAAVRQTVQFDLASLLGGNMHNAIPREAFATVTVSPAAKDMFEKAIKQELAAIQAEFKPAEPDLNFEIAAGSTKPVLTKECAATVLNLANCLPHGVISMSYDIPELVETSVNLASVKVQGEKLLIHVSTRSSVDSAIRAIQRSVVSIGELAGAEVKEVEGYPGWKPNLNSQVLQTAKAVYKQSLGLEPEIKAIHAGLECGIIGQKYPGMDMVSLGPQIEFPHSPDERCRIGSVADFYKLLLGVLGKLAS